MITMAKIHISPELGPKQCRAQEGNCPVTSATGGEHYDNLEEAQAAYEKMLEKEHGGSSSSLSKTKAPREKLFHIDLNRETGRPCTAASESHCRFRENGHYKTLEEANTALQQIRQTAQKNEREQRTAKAVASGKAWNSSELPQREGELFHIVIQGDRKGVALCKSQSEQMCQRKEYGHYKTLDEAKQAFNKMFKQEKKKEPSPASPTRTATTDGQNNSDPSKKRKTGLMERLTGRRKQGSEI